MVERSDKFFNEKYKEIMQMKENFDMESLNGQEMQLVRYKEKLKDYVANIFKTYVDVKKPEQPQI
jgi:hypothetical protein